MNLKVRIKSKAFWLALVPAFLLLVQTIATPFGYTWDFAGVGTQLTAVVNAVFGLLSILGIAVDPTTAGVTDSTQALTYDKPKKDEVK